MNQGDDWAKIWGIFNIEALGNDVTSCCTLPIQPLFPLLSAVKPPGGSHKFQIATCWGNPDSSETLSEGN